MDPELQKLKAYREAARNMVDEIERKGSGKTAFWESIDLVMTFYKKYRPGLMKEALDAAKAQRDAAPLLSKFGETEHGSRNLMFIPNPIATLMNKLMRQKGYNPKMKDMWVEFNKRYPGFLAVPKI